MSRVCSVCNKGQNSGNNVSHSNRKTRRTFKANVQKVKIVKDGKRFGKFRSVFYFLFLKNTLTGRCRAYIARRQKQKSPPRTEQNCLPPLPHGPKAPKAPRLKKDRQAHGERRT